MRLALATRRAHLRQVDVDNVAKLMLSVIGDADGAGVALDGHPLVFLRVPKIVWIHVLFRSLIERRRHDHGIHRLIADHDLNCVRRLGRIDRKDTQTDILVQRRRRAAAGNPAGGIAVDVALRIRRGRCRAPVISKPTSVRFTPSAFCFSSARLAKEICRLIELHDPAEVRFERRDTRADLVSVKRHFGFQPQRVSRAQDRRA